MKPIALATAITFAFTGAALAADPLEGIWETTKDDNGNYGHIEVTACGDAFCGILIKSFDSSGKSFASDNIGKQIIWDMEPRGNGRYAGGKVWSPDRDKTYNSRITLDGDKVTVNGCVLVVCRDGGTWLRVK